MAPSGKKISFRTAISFCAHKKTTIRYYITQFFHDINITKFKHCKENFQLYQKVFSFIRILTKKFLQGDESHTSISTMCLAVRSNMNIFFIFDQLQFLNFLIFLRYRILKRHNLEDQKLQETPIHTLQSKVSLHIISLSFLENAKPKR